MLSEPSETGKVRRSPTFLSSIEEGSVLGSVSHFNDFGTSQQLHDKPWGDNRWDTQLHQSTWGTKWTVLDWQPTTGDLWLLTCGEDCFRQDKISSTSVWSQNYSHPVERICWIWWHDAKERNLNRQHTRKKNLNTTVLQLWKASLSCNNINGHKPGNTLERWIKWWQSIAPFL